MKKQLYLKRVKNKTYRLCNYHHDSTGWVECSEGSKGCEIKRLKP